MAWVVVVGRIGRHLALRTARLPDEGGTEPVIERFDRLGGKGPNQAVGLARLGVPVDLIGVVDLDAAGAAMVGEAAADGIDVGHRQSTPTTPTAACPRLWSAKRTWTASIRPSTEGLADRSTGRPRTATRSSTSRSDECRIERSQLADSFRLG